MNTLILSGFGTNCERETAYACQAAGAAQVDIRHIASLYTDPLDWAAYDFLVLIGGFLDGDDLGGARACANRFRNRRLPEGDTVLQRLQRFVDSGRLVLGICNGFQLLVKLGLLPGLSEHEGRQTLTLTTNAGGRFEDRWVKLRVEPDSPSVFTAGLEALELPVRHGEGRMLAAEATGMATVVERHLAPLRYVDAEGQPTETYPANPNGSALGIASLCNPRGTVLGLMPHPEGFNHYTNHPSWTRQPKPADESGAGLALFRNAARHLEENRPLPF